MTLNQLQEYIVGVLQGYFPNKAVLDKLSEGKDGTLLFGGQAISGETIVTDAELQQAITDTLTELGLTDSEAEKVLANVASLKALQTAIANGANVITVTEPFVITEDVTLSAKEPVSITANFADAFTVTSGTLTLGENINMFSDISLLYAKDGGAIVVDGANLTNTNADQCLGAVDANSTFIMKSGTMTSEGTVMACMGQGAQFVMNGGTVETIGGTSEKPYCAMFAHSGGVAEVAGGLVKAAVGYGLVSSTNGTVKVTGGTVYKVQAHNAKTAVAEISGGAVNGDIIAEDGAVLTVTGGTFDTDPSAYVADNCTVLKANDRWNVVGNM